MLLLLLWDVVVLLLLLLLPFVKGEVDVGDGWVETCRDSVAMRGLCFCDKKKGKGAQRNM